MAGQEAMAEGQEAEWNEREETLNDEVDVLRVLPSSSSYPLSLGSAACGAKGGSGGSRGSESGGRRTKQPAPSRCATGLC